MGRGRGRDGGPRGVGLDAAAHDAGEGLDRLRLEEDDERDLGAEDALDLGHHAHGQERVAAQVEEVVGHAEGAQIEHLAPDGGEADLHLVAGGDRAGLRGHAVRGGLGERAAIHLAGRGLGQGGEHHEGGRHHVLGEPLDEEGAQVEGRRRVVAARHQVGDELAVGVPGAAIPGDHHGVAHRRVRAQHRLYLAQLHPVAADLDLEVGAAEDLEGAVGAVAGAVAGAVHARAPGTHGSGTKRAAVRSGRPR